MNLRRTKETTHTLPLFRLGYELLSLLYRKCRLFTMSLCEYVLYAKFCTQTLALILGGAACAVSLAQPGAPLVLNDQNSRVDAWPFIRILDETPGQRMNGADAIARLDQFARPDAKHATLGIRKTPVWVHLPLEVSAGSDIHWVANIDYPPLHHVDFFLARDGKILSQFSSGTQRPFFDRALDARSHAAPLELANNARFDLLVRIETGGATVLPFTIESTASFHKTATFEQMLQGLLVGIAICLVFYSFAQFFNSREYLFLKYALLVIGSLTFTLLQLGVGPQFAWRDSFWFDRHAAGLSSLAAIAGTFLFLEESLRALPIQARDTGRWFPRLMKGGAWICLVIAVLFVSGFISTAAIAVLVTLMGPLPSLIAAPKVLGRAGRGDPVGWYLLIAFAIYMVGVVVITGVIRGYMPVSFWTLHVFQFSATLDMLAFMYVLTLRAKAIRVAALHASREADIMRALAHSDPLTGLANRRSLSAALDQALRHCGPDNLLAVFVIDLDNFKPVNDQFGHDVGDELLIAVSQRIKENVRTSDVVSRLGGDEFVILASGLRNDAQAEAIGESLLAAFRAPVHLSSGREVTVSLTVGYAIAPTHGRDSVTLLKLADDAMYSGKQRGKGALRRA